MNARKKRVPKSKKARAKIAVVMHEFKSGKLPMGKSKRTVTNPKQAIAIALSESRRIKSKRKRTQK